MDISLKRVVLAIASLFTTVLAAQQSPNPAWITVAQGKVASGSTLHIRTAGGKVRIEPTSGAVTTYVIRREESRPSDADSPRLYQVKTYAQSGKSWLIATRSSEVSARIHTELVVNVPASIQLLELETDLGMVAVGDINASLKIQSGGGMIALADIGGSVSVENAGLDIEVGSVNGNGRFYTGGGRISVRQVKGNVDAWTGGGNILVDSGGRNALLRADSGDVRLHLCRGELKVESGGGNLILGDIGGRADIRTSAGNVRVHSAQGFVHAQTSGGNIELSAVPSAHAETGGGSISATFVHSEKPFQPSFLKTSSGDISVYLPADLAVTIQASVDQGNVHKITSNIPELRIESSGDGWPKSIFASGKLSGGGPLLKIYAADGNISIRRATAPR